MSTATIHLPSVPCIHLRGDVDMSRLQDLADLLRNFQSTDAASACVYLEEVTFMGSTCLAFLVSLRNECLERGGSVTLVAPTAVARHLLHLVGFDDAFEILEP